MVKRVRKYGEGRMTICAETGNRCFGRAVYEDLQTGGLVVIVSLVSGDPTLYNMHKNEPPHLYILHKGEELGRLYNYW